MMVYLLKIVIFHGYVKQPEGVYIYIYIPNNYLYQKYEITVCTLITHLPPSHKLVYKPT